MSQASTLLIKEHATIIGSDGKPVGTVDHVQGDRIKLTRSDPMADGHHHYLPTSDVVRVEDRTVHLRQTAEQAMREWTTA